MPSITNAEVLNLENVRLQEIQNIRNKGVEISNSATISQVSQKIKDISSATDILDKSIKSIESMDVTRVENYAFTNCVSLKKAYFPNATVIGDYAFNNTTSLTDKNGFFDKILSLGNGALQGSGFINLVFPLCASATVSAGWVYTFYGMSRLKKLIAPKLSLGGTAGGLSSGTPIEILDVDKISGNQWLKGTLQTVILRNNSTISSATGSVTSVLANATIYVPESLLSTYQSATNWSAIADQIVKLEGTKYESEDWYKTEDWFLNMYHYTSVLDD